MPSGLRETSTGAAGTSVPEGLQHYSVRAGVIESDNTSVSKEISNLPEWKLANRVAFSRAFSKSELLRRFLLYVCEQRLQGNSQAIAEQHIGIRVFNRLPGYDPGRDNIVRNYTRMLRKRLDEYFDNEGSTEPMRMYIPRGGYAPVFQRLPIAAKACPAPAAASSSPTLEEAALIKDPHLHVEGSHATPARWSEKSGVASRRDHNRIFDLRHRMDCFSIPASRTPSICGSSCRGEHLPASAQHADRLRRQRIGILQNLTRHQVPLEEYVNGTHLAEIQAPSGLDIQNLNDIRTQRYTSFVDVNITAELTQLPEFIANRAQIRFARGISTEDLRGSNAILIGSSHTNPWVSLLEKNLNVKLKYTSEVNLSFVLNQHPAKGEQRIYRNGPDAEANTTFGVVDYLPSLDGKGHVLLIQGLNMAATQASADILFDSDAMPVLLTKAVLPDGSVKPFELLVETRSIGANAPGARIVATRFYP